MKIFRIVVVACVCLFFFRFVVTFPVSYFFRFYYVLCNCRFDSATNISDFVYMSISIVYIYMNIYSRANIATRIVLIKIQQRPE